MINEVIHWFDADYTLWNTNAKLWILNKKNPSKYLLRVSQQEGNNIISGLYKNDGHEINYNGITGWISKELWIKIQRTKALEESEIGLSIREYQDDDLIETQTENLLIYINNILHLAGTKDVINILTARGRRNSHDKLLTKLKDHLGTHDINIHDAIFVNDPSNVPNIGTTSEKKMLIILQNIVGYKISNQQFEPMIMDKYDVSNFYDDEEQNIEECKNINMWLKQYLDNTIPWLKQKIEEHVSINKPTLYLNQITSNELNPFVTNKIDIKII